VSDTDAILCCKFYGRKFKTYSFLDSVNYNFVMYFGIVKSVIYVGIVQCHCSNVLGVLELVSRGVRMF